jgi:nucleotide-binding universal stress UspA family protein
MRDILVHATRYDEWSNSTRYAARLAALMKGALTGLWCVPPTDAVVAGDVGAMVAIAATRPNPQLEAAAAVEENFHNWASSLGVAHSDWLVCEADAADALRHAGQWHDLLVLGAGKDARWGSEPALAEILVSTHMPCLIVPEGREQSPRLECVAVAWNASVAALRALHSALPLLMRAGRIVVLAGGKGAVPGAPSFMPGFDLDRYWQRHGLVAEKIVLEPMVGAAGPALMEAALAANADLLVLGAFGRTRLSEWMLGGVSRHMLEHSAIPLLMRH